MKKSKRNYAFIVLVVILLVLAIGYATFSATLKVEGTVTGEADFDVKFTNASISPTPTDVTRDVSFTDTVLTVEAELCYPGDGCEVTATITNEGNLDADLTSLKVVNHGTTTDFADSNVIVNLPSNVQGETLHAGDTCQFTFTIQWDEESEATDLGTVKFDIIFDYEQADNAVNVTPSHSTH